jgi:hypothetical protein
MDCFRPVCETQQFGTSVLQSGGGEIEREIDEVVSQSKELTRGLPELVQHFRLQRDFTSAQERCMS